MQRCFVIFMLCIGLWACGKDADTAGGESKITEPVISVSAPSNTPLPSNTPTPTPIPNPAFADTTLLPKSSDDGWSEAKKKRELLEKQYRENQFEIEKKLLTAGKELDLPIVSFTTLDGQQISRKDAYVPTMVTVTNCEKEFALSAFAGVKVRGNSTAESDPRPYRIKFADAQGMLGLHEGNAFKSWVLLKINWNLGMDYTAFHLYRAIHDGDLYSSDCCFVNVFINGSNKGLYLLCEQNQACEGRVEVTEPKEGDTSLEIGYFLELDNYPGEKPGVRITYSEPRFTDILGVTREFRDKLYSIKSDVWTEGQRAFIENYMNGVTEILLAAADNRALMFDGSYQLVSAEGIYTPQQAVEAVLDTASAIDMMILSELSHDYDVGEGSFYLAVDFNEAGKYRKLTFIAPWDYNWAYYPTENDERYFACTFQEPYDTGFYDRSNFWYIVLMKMDWFQEEVRVRWKALCSRTSLEITLAEIDAGLEECRRDLREESWKVDCGHDIVKYVKARILWLNSQWGLIQAPVFFDTNSEYVIPTWRLKHLLK